MVRTKSLVDLMGDEVNNTTPHGNGGAPTSTVVSSQTTQDLLADIFGTGGDPPPTSAPKSSVNDILGLFDTNPSTPATTPMTQPQPTSSMFDEEMMGGKMVEEKPQSFVAYDQHGLQISLIPSKDSNSPQVLNITAQFVANGLDPIQNVNFQAAVPKV